MIGPRVGMAVGPRVGIAVGPGADPIMPPGGVIAGVTRDPTSGKYAPATAGEWTLLMAAAGLATGNPTAAWTLQDASGNPTDFMGGAVVLAANGAPTYQSPSTGWARVGIRFTDGVASQRLFNNVNAPNPATVSTLVGAYIEFPASAPAAARGLITKTGAAPRVSHNTTGKLQLVDGATSDLVNPIGTGVKLVWFLTDITASKSAVYTETEEFVGTYALPAAGAFLGLAGTTPAVSGAQNWLYTVEFSGTAAQLSKAQIRTLSTTLGWSVAF